MNEQVSGPFRGYFTFSQLKMRLFNVPKHCESSNFLQKYEI